MSPSHNILDLGLSDFNRTWELQKKLQTKRILNEIEDHFLGKGYGDLKSELTNIISESLAAVRTRYKELIEDKAYLKSVLSEGAEAAQKRAYKILSKVYRKVGFPERDRK